MITAEWKPMPELVASLKGHRKVLLMGCATCVAECATGGEREVETLAPLLKMALKQEGQDLEVITFTPERQCEPEFLAEVGEKAAEVDAIMSLACGIGMQLVAETFPEVAFIPESTPPPFAYARSPACGPRAARPAAIACWARPLACAPLPVAPKAC
jgi:hypothetical protein